jgi:hypothetical protein
LPHSGIPGSTPACGSPRLIAANHALHRFLAPRHPPCALSSLTIKPLPTNGLQVEGQGSEQEPWFRSVARPTSQRQIIATKTLLIDSRLRLRSFSNDRVNNSLFSFQSPRDIAARGGNYNDFPTRVKLPRPSPFGPAGGGNGTRTHDPRLAKPMLYQLSYSPRRLLSGSPPDTRWARQDLNLRPHAYQACALTN